MKAASTERVTPHSAPDPGCHAGDEGARLAALQDLQILETSPSEEFDRLTRIASRVLGVPIALVSLVDESRQWFKSRVGLEVTETPRAVAFCSHAIGAREPLLVSDALEDPRFRDNPLVNGEPHVRAYAGVPLFTTAGHVVGTLCAIDRRPRVFSDEQMGTLLDLAAAAQDLLRARERELQARHDQAQDAAQLLLYRSTFEQAPIGIAHTALGGQVLRVNPALARMLGYPAESLQGTSFIDITHPDDLVENIELFQQLIEGKRTEYQMDKRFLCADQTWLWTRLSVRAARNEHGRIDYLVTSVADISERKRQEEIREGERQKLRTQVELLEARLQSQASSLRLHIKQQIASEREARAAHLRLKSIADSIPALVGYWSADLRCEFANEAYREWYGRSPEEIIGLSFRELLGDLVYGLNEPHARSALHGRTQRFTRTIRRPDGSERHVDAQYIPDFAEDGTVLGFSVLVTDITELHQARLALESANSKLRVDSATDHLTGLANRKRFSQATEAALQAYRSAARPYGLILLDLDNFKQINDVFGHATGDEVLRVVGRVLREQLRGPDDVAARLGGEEFALLCCGDLNAERLIEIAERVRAQMNKKQLATANGELRFTSSLGAALSEAREEDWTSIYSRADAALYRAKTSGKDRVIFGARRPT